jgi:hypothetical protein
LVGFDSSLHDFETLSFMVLENMGLYTDLGGIVLAKDDIIMS